ncbi:MAG: site-specific integrase [Alkaliphilus sp.]
MARVFSGRVIIPGDKMEEYLKAVEEAEEAREPFRQYLNSLNEEFKDYLMLNFSQRTARKHAGIVLMFIQFLCGYTDVDKIEDITRGMANTHFRQWYKRKVWDSSTPNDLKVAIRKFFLFLIEEKGIINEKVLQGLRKK